MKKRLILFCVALLALTLINDSLAIPAFARKYSMSCQTCHSPFPRLKAYGDEFAGNGFQLSDREAPRYFVETGDDQLSLIRDFPLALRIDGFMTLNNKKSEKLDFSSPYLVKLLSGGSITKDISYYLYFFFGERGEVAGLEDAFIMFNNLFNIDLDIYVGQFQVSDPLFKGELRTTYENYLVYRMKPGALSKIDLTYDRGAMITLALETGTDVIFEVTNGNGIGSMNSFRVYDDDKYKSLVGRVSQNIGEFARIGGFVYSGKEELSRIALSFDNKVTFWGPDMSLAYGDLLELNLQYMQRKDSDPYGLNQACVTKGGMAELIFTPNGDNSKWYATGLFNWIESGDSRINARTATAHFGYMLKRNLRLTAEYTYNLTLKFNQFVAGFSSAF